jgi:hypothetical protein
MVENNPQSSLIDQYDPWEVLAAWLDKFGLSPNHILAIREVSRNLALLHANHPLGQGRKNYSFVVAAIANDWEAQLLLAIHGYPAQALALVRGTYEKIAWLKLFLDDPDRAEIEYERSVKAERPLFGRRLIAEAFGEKFFHDVVAPLNKATHPDLMRLSIFHVDLDKGTPGNPQYRVGPNFDFQYSHAMHLVLQSGATWALSCLETLTPPEGRGASLYNHVVEVVESLRRSGLQFSPQTDEQIQRLNVKYAKQENSP